MNLPKTTASLTAILSGAFTTTAPTYLTAYHNQGPSGGSGNGSNGSLATTATTIVPAPATGESLAVDLVNIYNADTVAATITVNYLVSATSYPLAVVTLQTGETLQYLPLQGWRVIDTQGRVKTVSASGPIVSSSANAFSVGLNGTTNPAFNVDASTSSAATGWNVTAAAAAGGVDLKVISSGTNEVGTISAKGSSALKLNSTTACTGAVQIGGAASGNNATGITVTPAAAASGVAIAAVSTGSAENLTLDAKGTGTLTLQGTATGTITIGANLTMADAKNIILNATTGTKIGTATTQKLSFYNSTPIVQPTASADTTSFVAGSGTASKSDSTWTGASGSSAYTVGGVITALKALGLLAA